MRWVLVNMETNIVEHVIIWDGIGNQYEGRSWLPIQLNENEQNTCVGWIYDPNTDPRFTAPDVLETT